MIDDCKDENDNNFNQKDLNHTEIQVENDNKNN